MSCSDCGVHALENYYQFSNSKITAEIKLSTGKIAKGDKNSEKICGERRCNLEQLL
jgi:hypothetical protein